VGMVIKARVHGQELLVVHQQPGVREVARVVVLAVREAVPGNDPIRSADEPLPRRPELDPRFNHPPSIAALTRLQRQDCRGGS
jgi:hypothetical protein